MSHDEDVPLVQDDPTSHHSRDTYHFSIYALFVMNHSLVTSSITGALLDRGANGGLIGADAAAFHIYQCLVDVTGIDEHALAGLPICDAAGKVLGRHGWVIDTRQQCALHGKGASIISCGQVEHYGNKVDDRSMKVGGSQCVRTLDGYIIPLNIHNGLVYLPIKPYTEEEWITLAHVVMTGPGRWDPKALDNALTQCEDWRTVIANQDQGLCPSPFDERGNHRFREPTPHYSIEEDIKDDTSVDTPVQDIDDEDSSTNSIETHLSKT